MKKIIRFFDKIEDKVRGGLSRRLFVYAFVGGALHVLFWRGVWMSADILKYKGGIWGVIFYEPITLIWTTLSLILIGLFVSIFIGDSIIMSGIKHTKKVTEKTEKEIIEEDDDIKKMTIKVEQMSKDIEEIKTLLKK